MFQKIVETSHLKDLTIHTLDNGALIAGFEVDLFDEEVYGLDKSEAMLQSILRDLPEGRILRVYLKSEYTVDSKNEHSRSEALRSIGFIQNRAYVFLEKPAKTDLSLLFKKKGPTESSVLTDFQILKSHGVQVRSLSQIEIES
ncbi:hypothetical protein, partial [Bdellovibrio sp.]|uniref:hypothetical protein n=1 Tax=Bdellovibrio sp. TaxID=28201 RepID=UPI003221E74B